MCKMKLNARLRKACSCKVIKMKTAVKVVELMEDRSLFAGLMTICKSRLEVDIKEAIALYKFSVVQGLFLPLTVKCCTDHARVLLCTYWRNSRVNLAVRWHVKSYSTPNAEVQFKVAIVDGMAEIQLDKPELIKTCKHLAEHFHNHLFSKHDETQGIR